MLIRTCIDFLLFYSSTYLQAETKPSDGSESEYENLCLSEFHFNFKHRATHPTISSNFFSFLLFIMISSVVFSLSLLELLPYWEIW